MKAEKILTLAVTLAGLLLSAGDARAEAPSAWGSWTSDAYDQTYWVRPHNTYRLDQYAYLDYPLWLGIRALELDVHEFTSVNGVRQFPVKHDAGEPDTWNNCRQGQGGYLRDCLTDIRNWSNRTPGHLPITLQIDLKREWTTGWGDAQFDELHQQIAEILGDRLYRPDELRSRNGYDSIRTGVAVNGWPSLGELSGKVIVLIMGGPFGDKNDAQEAYVRRYKASANFFVCPNADSADDFYYYGHANDFDEYDTNKWVVCGNVGSPQYWKDIADSAADNHQLMNLWGDGEYDEFHKMYLAIGWGATMISRGNEDTWGGKLPLNGVRRSVPVEFKIINENSNKCASIRNASYSNGSDVIQSSCTGATSQYWVYSDETQLRARGNNAYCYDIEGGDGDLGDRYHIWNCDGGDSEKWRLQPDGSFVGMNDRCMDVPNSSTANGVQLWHYDCNGTTAQQFYLGW